MFFINKVTLMGNLTRDPQLRYTPNQTAVVDFGMAMNRVFKSADGNKSEEVTFVDCTMFGKRAETVDKWFKKGTPIFVEGRLSLDSWETKEGQKRQKIKVIVDDFEFVSMGKKPETESKTAEEPAVEDDKIPF